MVIFHNFLYVYQSLSHGLGGSMASRVLRGGGQNRGTGDHLEPDVLEEEPPEADVTKQR